MPFAIAHNNSIQGAKFRAYMVPQEVLDKKMSMEPFVIGKPEVVETMLLEYENDEKIRQTAKTLGLPHHGNKKDIVKDIAKCLCDFSDDADTTATGAEKNVMFSVIRAYYMLEDDERDVLFHFCVAEVSGYEDYIKEIHDEIKQFGKTRLAVLVSILTGVENKKDFIIEFVQEAMNHDISQAMVIEVEDVIHLHADGEKDLVKFYIRAKDLDKTITVYADHSKTGYDLLQYFEMKYGIGRGNIRFTWGTSEAPSELQYHDRLANYMFGEKTMNLVFKVKGGAKSGTGAGKDAMKVMKEHIKNEKVIAMKKAVMVSASAVERTSEDVVKIGAMLDGFLKETEHSAQTAIKSKVLCFDAPTCEAVLRIIDGNKGNPEFKAQKLSQHLFGADMVDMVAKAENYSKVSATCSRLGAYAFTKAGGEDGKFNMGVFRALVDKQLARLHGASTTSASVADVALEEITDGMGRL
eukprot:s2170_g6.t1